MAGKEKLAKKLPKRAGYRSQKAAQRQAQHVRAAKRKAARIAANEARAAKNRELRARGELTPWEAAKAARAARRNSRVV